MKDRDAFAEQEGDDQARIRIDTQAKRKKMRLMMISFSLLVMDTPESIPGRDGRAPFYL